MIPHERKKSIRNQEAGLEKGIDIVYNTIEILLFKER